MRYTLLLVLSFFSYAFQNVQAQGCSDAGFCTISSFQPDSTDTATTTHHQIKIGAFYGKADHAIGAYGMYVTYAREFSDRIGAEIKLTSLGQSGNDISAFGVSDVFVTMNYAISKRWKSTIGIKIPLSNADAMEGDLPLPMDYQASLGTFDLIFGLAYTYKKWKFVAAIQQPLTQNGNAFFATDYPLGSPLRGFQSTNDFIRKGDVMLRVAYPLGLGDKWVLTPSVLPIYHLGEDAYVDQFGVERTIVGSDGLTLNGNVYLDYKFKDNQQLQFNVGWPFIVREARPDGLTRSYIFTLEYQYNF